MAPHASLVLNMGRTSVQDRPLHGEAMHSMGTGDMMTSRSINLFILTGKPHLHVFLLLACLQHEWQACI